MGVANQNENVKFVTVAPDHRYIKNAINLQTLHAAFLHENSVYGKINILELCKPQNTKTSLFFTKNHNLAKTYLLSTNKLSP